MDEIKCYLKKIHNRMEANFNKVLRNYGLTGAQFDLLVYLTRNDKSGNTLTDISAHFGVKHTSAIHVLKILEKKGLIEKNKSADARSKTITLTGKGRQVMAEFREKAPSVNKIVFAGISESELELLKKMLSKIYKNIQSDEFQNLQD